MNLLLKNTELDLVNHMNNKYKKGLVHYLLIVLLVYSGVYGTASIFLDNAIFRYTKDILLLFLIFFSACLIFFKNNCRIKIIITHFYLFVSITVCGTASLFFTGGWIEIIYGLKITILPMCMIFVGFILGEGFVKTFYRVNLLLYFGLILCWIIQYNLGIDKLMTLGYEYGVNVKHFNGNPRLPSLVGTPDSYAFLLALLGIIIEYGYLKEKNVKLSYIIKVSTLVFLILATIRNALLFWILFQVVMLVRGIKKKKVKVKYLSYSVLTFSGMMSVVVFSYLYNKLSSGLFSTTSLVLRLLEWKKNVPSLLSREGIFGAGLGTVGSASRRISQIGADSLDIAVDNQFLAFYHQIGVIGIIFLVIFIILNGIHLKKLAWKNDRQVQTAYILFLVSLVSCFFTNIYEVFPFNIFLWLYMGISYSYYKNSI
ncbi:hypothetical protein [Priestia megaterium]|uniref:hypothetical protein n=1 Tax=Priestia megaterium TaxID=1404 RepID=UPI0035A81E6C